MKTEKSLGICMDHSSAHLIEFITDPIETVTIESKFTHQEKEHSLSRGEDLMHNKEQHLQAEYYKKLGEIIRNYDKVLLFGPTEAKVELFNIISEDHNFSHIKIEMIKTDKMTDNQEHAFVKEYFSKHKSN